MAPPREAKPPRLMSAKRQLARESRVCSRSAGGKTGELRAPFGSRLWGRYIVDTR